MGVFEVGGGDADAGEVELGVADVEGGDAVGLGDAGGVQEDGLDDAEDGGVGAYSEGEGQDGDEGEGGSVS